MKGVLHLIAVDLEELWIAAGIEMVEQWLLVWT